MKFPKVKLPKFNLKKTVTNVRTNKRVVKATSFVQRKPFTSFLVALIVLFAVMIVGSVIQSLSKKPATEQKVVKDVQTYTIGDTAKVTYQGKVEDSGVVTIVAQSAGVVQQINVTEGQQVAPAQTLVSLSSNYQGGNAPALQAQLANAQLQNVLDTFDTQKALIGKQREVADQTNANSQQLAQIQANSIDDIQANLNLNNTILTTLYANLASAQQTGDPAQILQAQSAVAQVQGVVTQLNSQLSSAQLQASPTLPPTQLSNLQQDITKKQLDISEKSLELTKKSAQIQANLAAVNAAVMYPATPVAGTVERIHVQVGDSVQPGTVVATVGGVSGNIIINVLVPQEVALLISRSEPSTLMLGNEAVKVVPYYVSTVPTNGQLYSALYSVDASYANKVTQDGYISVTIPLLAVMTKTDPYIPIDSVYQTQNNAFVFVVSGNKAATKEVKLGEVFGNYAQILQGLVDGDEIILERNVIAGEQVKITNK